MLKTRVLATLLVRNGIVVQSIGFERFLPVGRLDIAVRYLNSWGIDEIAILDITASSQGRTPNTSLVAVAAANSLVPVAFGGGITEIGEMTALIQAGADKVIINSAFVRDPHLITKGAERFGAQAMIVAIDARKVGDGYVTFVRGGSARTDMSPREVANLAEKKGAGEILLTSIDRDGSQMGYDLELLRSVTSAVSIPVIAAGGVGKPEHFQEALALPGVHAVAAGNFFHFSEHSVITSKRYLVESGAPIRVDTHANYRHHQVDSEGRLLRLPQEKLDALRFVHVEEDEL